MIDTNELQLGNKLYFDNGALVKIVDVTDINISGVNGYQKSKFNPIPLDGAWLFSMGIPKWKRYYYKTKFKFVHRLQNYFNLKQLIK